MEARLFAVAQQGHMAVSHSQYVQFRTELCCQRHHLHIGIQLMTNNSSR